ncbi:NUDIX domain-containing protein [Streptomyces aureus]|uniref:NUDIX domain-containing protein n=1 Tax=Streptomyces aureus TaxID=193461 RepID=UPI0033DEF41E
MDRQHQRTDRHRRPLDTAPALGFAAAARPVLWRGRAAHPSRLSASLTAYCPLYASRPPMVHENDLVALLSTNFPAHDGTYLLLPGSRREDGKGQLECARRELREEAGGVPEGRFLPARRTAGPAVGRAPSQRSPIRRILTSVLDRDAGRCRTMPTRTEGTWRAVSVCRRPTA